MKRKIIISVLTAMLFQQQAIAAYPQSNVTVNFNEIYNVPGTQSWAASPEENIFTVDGKKFILLDTDSEGNYFVLTEEHYGTYAFEKDIPNSVLLQTAETVDGVTTFTDAGADLTDTDSWRFNPERESNIAYWLNNGFAENGNTAQHIFPERVYNHILETTWQTEGFNCFRGWTAASYYDDKYGVTNASDFAKSYNGSSYEFTSKLALLSYTEYMEYKDKIGVTFNNGGGWSGMMLRTCDAMVTGVSSGKSISITRSPLMVRTYNSDKTDNSLLRISYADSIASENYYVRPCFRLSKDFFAKVPCELEWDKEGNVSIGAVPLEMIKKHTYEELRTIYSDGQLAALGYTVLERDWYNYPVHSSEVKDLKAGENGSTGIEAYCEAPAENLFSVDGKSFILLDKDKDGNYFIMTNEEYGQRIFSQYSGANSKTWKETDWGFDPENTTSIAYWLNNEFLTNGGKFKNESTVWKLPQSIQDAMLVSDWDIEPHYPINSWTVNSYATAETKAEIEAWRNEQIAAAKKRTVSCKVALMSFTEYQKYKEKIGLSRLADGYAGFSLRTPRSQAGASSTGDSWSVTVGQLQVAINSNQLKFSTCGATNDVYYVRPVFRISRDFFKNNALDITSMGENVINEISKSYDYYDMRNIYSYEEMRALGINPEREITQAVPSAENVIIDGIVRVGSEITGNYKYISNDPGSAAAAERGSILRWYISDTAEGEKTLYAEGISCVPADEGKYITFGVTPVNAYGIKSDTEYFSRPVPVGGLDVVVEKTAFTNASGDEIENVNGAGTLNLDISFTSGSDCIVFLTAYNSDGKLIGMTFEDTPAGYNEKKMTLENLSGGGGAYARIIIFGADDKAVPLYSKTF